MGIDSKGMINNDIHAIPTIVEDKSSHRVNFRGNHSDTLIRGAAMMVSGKITLKPVMNAIHPHPTQTQMFGRWLGGRGGQLG